MTDTGHLHEKIRKAETFAIQGISAFYCIHILLGFFQFSLRNQEREKTLFSWEKLSVYFFRMALRIASTATPTSANTAIHMVAIPNALRRSTRILIPKAKTIFCITIFLVFFAMRRPTEIFRKSSSISTTSAASMAASEPIAPMAMPTSAPANTGASLMPSPTKAVLAPSSIWGIFSRICSLSAGSSSA